MPVSALIQQKQKSRESNQTQGNIFGEGTNDKILDIVQNHLGSKQWTMSE